MSRSKLTRKFKMLEIAKFERTEGKGLLGLIAGRAGQFIGKDGSFNFESLSDVGIGTILTVIRLGNGGLDKCNEEEAGEILDNYLSEEDTDLITAVLELVKDFDYDTKILKKLGIDVDRTISKVVKKMDTLGEKVDNTLDSPVEEEADKLDNE